MKYHPILFNGEMVRAILDGRKTQTRRVVKPQPWCNDVGQWLWNRRRDEQIPFHPDLSEEHYPGTKLQHVCPYGVPGDRLWVREAFALVRETRSLSNPKRNPSHLFRQTKLPQWPQPEDQRTIWKADGPIELVDGGQPKWKPSIHMPRWASRITLEVTDIRVERVQDISEKDAIAEGLKLLQGGIRTEFAELWNSILWNSINAKRGYGWDVNPWCWVVEFRKESPC